MSEDYPEDTRRLKELRFGNFKIRKENLLNLVNQVN